MKICLKQFIRLFLLTIVIGLAVAHAGTAVKLNLTPATGSIENIEKATDGVSEKSSIPVFFPALIAVPENSTRLYASASGLGASPDYSQAWIINVDATADCKGVHVCNVGSVTAEKGAKLDKKYVTLPGGGAHKKQRVKLEHGYTGYYTPFHTEAGGVNPSIEWRVKDVLYTLRWKLVDSSDKETLITMANSAIKAVNS